MARQNMKTPSIVAAKQTPKVTSRYKQIFLNAFSRPLSFTPYRPITQQKSTGKIGEGKSNMASPKQDVKSKLKNKNSK